MYKTIKVRIYPNHRQIKIIDDIMSDCRGIWNMYIEKNNKRIDDGYRLLSSDEMLKNIIKLRDDVKYSWIRKIDNYTIRGVLQICENMYDRYSKGGCGRPSFKSKKRGDLVQSYRFNAKSDQFNLYENRLYTDHLIHIPNLGNVRCTKKNRIPDQDSIMYGEIIKRDDKYFISFNYIFNRYKHSDLIKRYKGRTKYPEGIGIDLGIVNYATIANKSGKWFQYPSLFNEDIHPNYAKINNKIRRIRSIISRKVNINYKRLVNRFYMDNPNTEPDFDTKRNMLSQAYNSRAIAKLYRRLSRLYLKRTNYSSDFVAKIVHTLTITKPEYITIENLDIKGMLSNGKNVAVSNMHTLHDHIQQCKWYEFRERLVHKCRERKIELRVAGRYYASSKICSICGSRLYNLDLRDRVFRCPNLNCNAIIDRDANAALNLAKLPPHRIEIL